MVLLCAGAPEATVWATAVHDKKRVEANRNEILIANLRGENTSIAWALDFQRSGVVCNLRVDLSIDHI